MIHTIESIVQYLAHRHFTNPLRSTDDDEGVAELVALSKARPERVTLGDIMRLSADAGLAVMIVSADKAEAFEAMQRNTTN